MRDEPRGCPPRGAPASRDGRRRGADRPGRDQRDERRCRGGRPARPALGDLRQRRTPARPARRRGDAGRQRARPAGASLAVRHPGAGAADPVRAAHLPGRGDVGPDDPRRAVGRRRSSRSPRAAPSTARPRSRAPSAPAAVRGWCSRRRDPSGRKLLVDLRPGPGEGHDRGLGDARSHRRASRRSATRSSPSPATAFRGFGGRHNAIDQRGTEFYNWVQQENLSSGSADQLDRGRPRSARATCSRTAIHAAYYVQSLVRLPERLRLPARPRRALALADGVRPPARRLAGPGVRRPPRLRRRARPAARSIRNG